LDILMGLILREDQFQKRVQEYDRRGVYTPIILDVSTVSDCLDLIF